MEEKWPFLILTLALLTGVGVMMASIDRIQIINQWATKRCDIPVMFASSFFKPDEDPRSTSEFATDNFEFCMKAGIDSFMEILMAPVTALFSKHVSVTGNAMNNVNTMRNITQKLFSAFSGYIDKFYRRFNATVFEISKSVQFLRMAVRRISGIMMSFIYFGISFFNGILNAIQFVIKVVLIFCAILLVIIIFLFFVMFPVIPFIISTLAVIAVTVGLLLSVMSPSIAADANSKKSGFCFAEWTTISVMSSTSVLEKSVTDIKVGDQLADGAYVTAVIEMDGTNVELYHIPEGSVFVSGSHLIKGTDQVWKLVADDERAIRSDRTSSKVYCFNTTTNVITINNLQFRDWEEIANEDAKGQMIWNYMVSRMLNPDQPFSVWKENMKDYVNVALMGRNVLVKTVQGWLPIHTIQLGDDLLDSNDDVQKVCGVVCGEVTDSKKEDETWTTELYEWTTNAWIKGKSSLESGTETVHGLSLLTESGEVIIWDPRTKKEKRVRDFTEVGYYAIHETYSYVDARLRMKE